MLLVRIRFNCFHYKVILKIHIYISRHILDYESDKKDLFSLLERLLLG